MAINPVADAASRAFIGTVGRALGFGKHLICCDVQVFYCGLY